MLSKEEIDENISSLHFNEYSELISENYLCRSARMKCIELEYENSMLRAELEKYKSIFSGDLSFEESMNAGLYDTLLNESDIINQNNNDAESAAEKTAGLCDAVISGETGVFEKKVFYSQTNKSVCGKCGNRCVPENGTVKRSLYIRNNEAVLIEEIFPFYCCKECDRLVFDMFSNVKMKRNPLQDGVITAETIAFLIKEKYIMHRSFYTMELYWKQKKFPLNRFMMSRIIENVTVRFLAPLYERIKTELLKSDFIIADVSRIHTFVKDKNKCDLNEAKSVEMFVYRTSEADEKKIVFFYADNGSDDPIGGPRNFLKYYKGILHTDKTEKFEFGNRKFNLIPMWSSIEGILEDEDTDSDSEQSSERIGILLHKIKERYHEEADKDQLQLAVRLTRCGDLTDEIKEIAEQYGEKTDHENIVRISEFIRKNADKLDMFYHDVRISYDNEICREELSVFGSESRIVRLAENSSGYRIPVIIMTILRTIKANRLNPERYLTYYLKNIVNRNGESLPLMPWEAPSECREHMISEII